MKVKYPMKMHLRGKKNLCGSKSNKSVNISNGPLKDLPKNLCKRCYKIFRRGERDSYLHAKIYSETCEKRKIEKISSSLNLSISYSCHSCQNCNIKLVRAVVNSNGWKTSGIARNTICENCGNVKRRINTLIPIRYKDFKCERCNSLENLKYNLLTINETHKDEFKFTLKIQCQKCKKYYYFKEGIKNVFFTAAKILKFDIDKDGMKA